VINDVLQVYEKYAFLLKEMDNVNNFINRPEKVIKEY
jgi:hypothetical protein